MLMDGVREDFPNEIQPLLFTPNLSKVFPLIVKLNPIENPTPVYTEELPNGLAGSTKYSSWSNN